MIFIDQNYNEVIINRGRKGLKNASLLFVNSKIFGRGISAVGGKDKGGKLHKNGQKGLKNAAFG